MCAHHLITKIPINSPNDLRSDRWRRAIERMPDHIATLIHGDNRGLLLLIIPRNCAAISHLATAAGIEDSRIQCNLIAFNRNDLRRAFVSKAVYMIEQLRLHRLWLLLN